LWQVLSRKFRILEELRGQLWKKYLETPRHSVAPIRKLKLGTNEFPMQK
jgi:hypothetical protein